MSAVLDTDGLMESPLADLHALASEIGVEDYRLKRKPDLAVAILVQRGADEAVVRPAIESKYAELQAAAAEALAAEEAAAEAAAEERRAAQSEQRERGEGGGQRGSRGGRGGGGGERQRRERDGGGRGDGRQRGGRGDGQRGQSRRGEGRGEGRGGESKQREQRGQREPRGGRGGGRGGAEAAAGAESAGKEQTFAASGVFEPRQGGGGMLRATLGGRSKDDVEVGRAEARKFRLFRGDSVTGEAKKVRRAKGAGMLSSVATVNGVAADQIKGERVRFDDAETAPPHDRLAKKLFKAAPFGRGSRTLVVGPARGAASELLLMLAEQLGKDAVHTTLAIVAAPPEGLSHAHDTGYDIVTGSLAEQSADFTSGLKLAVERGKRFAEAGGDAVVIVDGIDLMPASDARDIFGAARNLKAHGSLTIVGSAAPGTEFEAVAGTTAVIADGRKLKLDKKQSWSKFGR